MFKIGIMGVYVMVALTGCREDKPISDNDVKTKAVLMLKSNKQEPGLSAENKLIRIEILNAKIDHIEVEDSHGYRSKLGLAPPEPQPPQLIVTCRITNLSENRKLFHVGWSDNDLKATRRLAVTLNDEHKNTYSESSFTFPILEVGGLKVIGKNSGSLYPGKAITDIMAFELPVSKAKFLTLAIPVALYDATEADVFTFRIPANLIGKQAIGK